MLGPEGPPSPAALPPVTTPAAVGAPPSSPGVAAPVAPPAPVATAPSGSREAPPWYRGSAISYRNVVSAKGLDRSADPTHNPYYAMQLLVAPRYWFGEKLYARASFDVSTELTRADWTTDRFYIGDVGLGLGVDGAFTLPRVGVTVGAELGLSVPTSKASRASTRVLGSSLSVSLAKKLGSVSLGYAGGVDKGWNRYVTGAATHQLLGSCDAATGQGCMNLLVENGRRNVNWALSNGLVGSWKANAWLGFSASLGVSTAFLYGLPPVEGQSLEVLDTSSTRYGMSSSLAVSLKTSDLVTMGLGARSSYAQLTPDGSYRLPFANRFTQLYLELNLSVAALVQKLSSY